MASVENRLPGRRLAASTGVCLLFLAEDEHAVALHREAQRHEWLVVNVELINAERGPWMGSAMPGSKEGCGIFAGKDVRTYSARSDADGIYLSATLDSLLSANGIHSICCVGKVPAAFAAAMRTFAVTRGYAFHDDPARLAHFATGQVDRAFHGDFASRVSSDSAALILIDFQNDFCAHRGAAGRTGASMRMIDRAVDRTRELLIAARRHKVFIVHVCAEYGKAWRSSSSPYRFPVQGRREPAVWTASAADLVGTQLFEEEESEVCGSGSWGAEFVDGLSPLPGEAILTKHRFGAFAGTGLDQLLRAHHISNVILAGVTTNCCVETAAREAVMREFSLVIVEDCVAVKDHLEDLHRATLETLGAYFGLVRPSLEIISAWSKRPRVQGA